MGKTPSSHIIHSLGGEYCWIVRDSEPIRLLKLPRSLTAYILNLYIYMHLQSDASISHFFTAGKVLQNTAKGNLICDKAIAKSYFMGVLLSRL